MSSSIISQRYARALLNIAVAAKQIEPIAAGLDDVADAITSSQPLSDLLADPKMPLEQKGAVLDELLNRIDPGETVHTFVRYLSSKRRTVLLDEIRRHFHRLADIATGHAQALVTVAGELDQSQKDRLRKKIEEFSGKTISLDVQVDADILGGVVTRIGSTVWDGSLRSHLNNIRQSIISE